MLILILVALSSASKCSTLLSKEGQSLVQYLIGDYTDSKLQSIAMKQLMYSGKDLNDLGHWSSCKRLKNSHYLIVDFNVMVFQTKIGLCVPKECSSKDIKEIIVSGSLQEHPLLKSSWSPSKIKVFKPETSDATAGVYMAWLGVFVLFLIIAYGSYLDVKMTPQKKTGDIELTGKETSVQPAQRKVPKYILLFQCFSFRKNWDSLFVRTFNDSTSIFEGVRALSMIWVIMGHVLLARLMDVAYNIEEIPETFESPFVTVLASTTVAVDGFFWLSGFLIGYLILDEAAKSRGRIRWGLAIIGRVLRIWPLYIAILVIVNFLITNLGEGPKWDQVENIIQNDCSDYWWTNLLFINNIYPWYTGNECIGQSWYMAADMQIYLLTIPCIIVYLKFPKKYGWMFLITVVLTCFTYRIIIASEYEVYIAIISKYQETDNYNKIHMASISRMTPYFLGLFSGFIFNYNKSGKSNDSVVKYIHGLYQSRIKSYISFVIGLALFNIAVWVPYKSYTDKDDFEFLGYSKSGNIVFNGFLNFLSSFGYSLMLLPTLYGMIPAAQALLSLSFWIPIAKSSFATYFIHITVVRLLIATEESASMFIVQTFITDIVFDIVVSILAGMLLYTCVECPFGKVVKLLLTPQRAPRKEQPLISTELKEQAIN